MIRTYAEKLLRTIIIKRRLPKEFGNVPLYVSSEGRLAFLFRKFNSIDQTLLNNVNEYIHDGDIVWDVGANVGLFTFAAAYRCGQKGFVVAIEPDVIMLQLLQKSVLSQPNTSARVEVIPVAVAETIEVKKFVISERARATNHLDGYEGSTQTGGARSYQNVISVTLDWLSQYYPMPTVLKIDVEGAELEVLKGGISLFQNSNPVVICEISNHSTAPQIATFFRKLGYQMFDADIDVAKREVLDYPAFNTIDKFIKL